MVLLLSWKKDVLRPLGLEGIFWNVGSESIGLIPGPGELENFPGDASGLAWEPALRTAAGHCGLGSVRVQ